MEIQYIPRVEAIAYPHFARQSLSIHPHTMDSENYSYVLEAACSAVYVAEGTIHFPVLDRSAHHFTFKTSPTWVMLEYHLTLGEDLTKVSGTIPEYVIKKFLRQADLGKPHQRNDLTEIITRNIRDHFLQEGTDSEQRGADYIQRVTKEVQALASADYYSHLEDLLNENHRQHLKPQKYLYELGLEESLDKSKLMRVELK